jgi:hypothetical protein
VSAAFVGGSAAWIYLVPDTRDGWAVALALTAFAAFHVACGAGIGRWWAVLLPALVTLTVIPSDRDREIPQWFDYLFFAAVPAALLLGAGVLLRSRLLRRRLDRAIV